MSTTLQSLLTPSNGYIFRITHRDNVAFILEHGVHCRSASTLDPAFVEIGHPDIIEARKTEVVATGPGGTLADYVPFYFTPCSPMLYNIVTGYNGVRQRARAEIVVLMSSLEELERLGIRVVFADRNARLSRAVQWAPDDPRHGELYGGLPWQAWQDRDFRHDPNDPAASPTQGAYHAAK